MENRQIVSPHWITSTSPLFFIQHQPTAGDVNKTAIIILSSGFLNNIGPYRLNVDIANSLTAQGFVVARVDQSGKGDSPKRLDAVGIDAKLADYDEVFEHLRSNFGVTRCILMGLCSGADDGLEIAKLRDTVSGLVFLDGFSPVTFWYYLYHYYIRFRHFCSWRQWKKRLVEKKPERSGEQKGDIKFSDANKQYNTGLSLRRWQSEENVKAMYESVLKKDVKIMAVFSGSAGDYYNHQGQLKKGLNSSTVGLQELFFEKAAHIYSNPAHRTELVRSISSWVQLVFLNK